MKIMKDLNTFIQKKIVKKILFILIDAFLLGALYALIVFLIHVYINPVEFEMVFWGIAGIIVVRVFALFIAGTYHIYLKSYGMTDLFKLMVTLLISGVVIFMILLNTTDLSVLEAASIFALTLVSDSIILSSYRIFYRMYVELFLMSRKGVKTLIIGAGDAGLMVLKSFNLQPANHPVGILDDDETKLGQFIYGVKVVGTLHDLEAAIKAYNVEEIVIAIVSIRSNKLKNIIETAASMNVIIKRLPSFENIQLGKPLKLRNVEVEDILERDVVELNMDSIQSSLDGKTIMVTGGGGSIGSELCRQIATFKPHHLIIVDFYENNAYEIQMILNRMFNYEIPFTLDVVIASVYNYDRMKSLFQSFKPDLVFHAAAYKHVPLMEESSVEAIRTNLLGTYNIALLSKEFAIKKMVLVSSDKAVRPTNVMGATKRVAERIVESMQTLTDQTIYSAVRFGNVLNSNGSVIPLFKAQIASGGPVTVTDENMTRYFMTTEEAVSLILEANTFSQPGEVFVLDMGSPVKIIDLATKLIQLSGYQPNVDIPIEIIGLRPGEKLYEELLVTPEKNTKTSHPKIFTEKVNTKPLDFDALSDVFGALDKNHTLDYKKYVFKLIEND